MRSRRTLTAAVIALLLTGCASQRQTKPPSDRLSKMRQEIETLHEEFNVAFYNLDALQRDLAGVSREQPVSPVKSYHSVYPIQAQERDLEHFIQILQRAKKSVNAEEMRLLKEYEVIYTEME